MNDITIIAIDRAEQEAGRAAIKLANKLEINVSAYTLVNADFKATLAYKGDETEGYFKEIICDFDDEEALRKILDEICIGKIVLHCRMEESIKDFKKVIPLLPEGTLVPSVDSLSLSTEKYLMREAMSVKHPEICPKFIKLENLDEYDESKISNFTFPVIVKPNGLHSSFFVKKCYSNNEVEEALQNAFAGLQDVYEREYGTGTPSLLIEEFMTGTMYSIDSYVGNDGLVTHLPPVRVTVAVEVGIDGYYGYQYDLPSDLDAKDLQDATICTNKVIESVGLTNCVAHVELYKTNDGWKIIEIGPRIGGYRQELYREAYGIDHYYNDLLLHLGAELECEQKYRKYASGLTIYADREGQITQIFGIEECKNIQSVVSISLDTEIGKVARFNSNGGQLLAIVVCSNITKTNLDKDISEVRDLIKFDVQE